MDTMAALLIFSVTVVICISIFLWFSRRLAHRNRSYLQQSAQKELFSPLSSSASSAFNSSELWQQSEKDFDFPLSPSQRLSGNIDVNNYINPNNSQPGWSSALYNSGYGEEKPQVSASGNRSIEHYERCIHVLYEPRIDGISLIFTNTVIANAVEVDNVFKVCERKFKVVMKARGWERVGWIGDLGEYTLVGTEATTLVGERLKLFLDRFGLKTKEGLYLISHYSSKATPPEQEALQEKLKRIQFMTAGVINKFHGHVFDTEEEAIAFYLRLRQEWLAGR